MPHSALIFSRHTLLLFLGALPRAQSFRRLAQIMDNSEALTHRLLRQLAEEGLVECDAERKRWQLCRQQRADRALTTARLSLQEASHSGELVQCLLQLQAGDSLGGCEQLLERIKVFIHDGASAATLYCLDLLLEHMGKWEYQGQKDSDIRRYLALVQCTQGLSMYMAKSFEASLALLPKAREAARGLGDMRILLLLDLVEACQQHLAQSHNSEHPRALLARTLDGIRSLGDPDILALTAHAIGILHFMQAEFSHAIEYLQQGNRSFFINRFDYLEEVRVRYIGSAACNLGQLDLAAGCVVAALHEAQLGGHRLTAKWYRVHFADELLRMGRSEQALELLDAMLPCCDPETETKLWIWAIRSLAYYHFQHGRFQVAHRLLYNAMEECVRLGFSRPYYGFTWLFDMLWTFYECGFAPIPGYDLERELAAALHSPSQMLVGAALRIRALQQEHEGGSAASVAALLRQSLHHLEAVKTPLEIARCHLALSRCLYRLGDKAQADTLYDKARLVLGRYWQYDCPPPRADAPPERDDIRVYVPPAEQCVRLCREMLEALPAWDALEEHLNSMVHCLRTALEVERVVLFRLDGKNSLHCCAACNISPLELESSAFAAHRHWVLGCSQSIARMTTDECAMICLPLCIPHGEVYVLFMQSYYTSPSIEKQDMSVFSAIGEICVLELRAALQLQARMLDTKRLTEERARLAAVRLDSKEAPHYGASLQALLRQSDQAAATDVSVCILGETGVGKEMLARRIHAHSGRSGPFVPVHPASTPESLFESEFFGHEKGAFTGAHRQKIGLVEVADKGTLFIDELGDVPMALQTKLLRVLQEKTFLRVGGIREIFSDFRLITATNRDLQSMVQRGSFREDLYYRVSVVPLQLPPLRDRPEDVLLMAELFLERYARRYQRRLPALTPQERQQLRDYAWPGNIRELKSVMERTVILYTGGKLHFDLPQPLTARGIGNAESPDTFGSSPSVLDWTSLPTMETVQKRYIAHVLQATQGKIDGEKGAANILGMKRATLYNKIKKFGLDAATRLYGKVSI